MFQRILSVLKEFVLRITHPKWLRMTGDENIRDLRVTTRRTIPVSNVYLETSKLRVSQNSTYLGQYDSLTVRNDSEYPEMSWTTPRQFWAM